MPNHQSLLSGEQAARAKLINVVPQWPYADGMWREKHLQNKSMAQWLRGYAECGLGAGGGEPPKPA